MIHPEHRLQSLSGATAPGEETKRTAFRTHCRCGAPLAFSCEDIVSGRPAEGADFWCGDPIPEKGPHDWGVVVYRESTA